MAGGRYGDDGLAGACSTRRRSYERSFYLDPTEAPRVPQAGPYGAGYIERMPVELPPVAELLGGVHVEPLTEQGNR